MNLAILNKEAVRSTSKLEKVRILSDEDLGKVTGGKGKAKECRRCKYKYKAAAVSVSPIAPPMR
ncbi:MAG: hypothetical protein ACPGWR_06015 [Ardenticatenaceae bacterium]